MDGRAGRREACLHPTRKPLCHVLQPEVVVHFETAGAHRAGQRKVLILQTKPCTIYLAIEATVGIFKVSEMYPSRICTF